MKDADKIIESWQPLVNPKSVAVVGASNGIGKWGFILPMNLVGGDFNGDLYMINPNEKSVQGLPTYKSLLDIGKPVDLVMVTVPAKLVSGVIDQCVEIGTKNMVVISSGFSEMSEEGREMENEIRKKALINGIRMIGPNTMGICSPPANLFPLGAFVFPEAGHVAFMSQSGNLGVQLLSWASRSGLGISRFIGSGNEAVVTCDQILEFYGADPETKVIIMYIEGIDNGSRFLEVARKVTPHKPVIALKMGATEAGARAAASHSGAVSTPHRVYQAMIKQAGIIEASSTEEMINLARTFGHLPIPKGRRVGVMTMGGGWGVVTTDCCAKAGLELPQPSDFTLHEIDQVLPEFWSHGNPVDLVGMMQRSAHYKVLEAMTRDPNFDSVITLGSLTGVQYSKDNEERKRARRMFVSLIKRHGFGIWRFFHEMAKGVREALKKKSGRKKNQSGGINLREARQWSDDMFANKVKSLMQASGKPIVPVPFDPGSVKEIFKQLGVVAFGIPEDAVTSLAKLADYNDFLERHKLRNQRLDLEAPDDDVGIALNLKLKQRSGALTEHESKEILTHYGIDVTHEKTASSEDDAVTAANEIGYPVVIKIDSPDIGHKSDAGCVVVGVENDEEVRNAYKLVHENAAAHSPDAELKGVAVQEMVTGGTEVLIGISTDTHYGKTIVFGLGGVFVEVLDDVSLRILPIELADAEIMVDEIKGRAILDGVRGQKKRDITALSETINRIASLAWDLRERLVEMDINPLVVFEEGKGVKALDALIILNEAEK
jgi:acetate---CoA ligase (ADP-forming)